MQNNKRQTPQEAKQWLLDHNFMELQPNSYFHWIEKDWFEKYKTSSALTFKNNSWIPRLDKLIELQLIDEAYKNYQYKQYGEQLHATEEINSLVESEEAYTNEKGEQLPF